MYKNFANVERVFRGIHAREIVIIFELKITKVGNTSLALILKGESFRMAYQLTL